MIQSLHQKAWANCLKIEEARTTREDLRGQIDERILQHPGVAEGFSSALVTGARNVSIMTTQSYQQEEDIKKAQIKGEDINADISAIKANPLRRIYVRALKTFKCCTSVTCKSRTAAIACGAGAGFLVSFFCFDNKMLYLVGACGGAFVGAGVIFLFERFKKCCCEQKDYLQIQNHSNV